jgi:DNA-binding NarL/FixJ family response regulator
MYHQTNRFMMTEAQIEVLVVSQPGLMQRILVDSLADLPVAVMGIASGGLSAVAMLEDHQPDLVIVDANLPPKEAQMLLKHIRESYPQVRCLVLTETSRELIAIREAGAHFSFLSFELHSKLPRVVKEVKTPPAAEPPLGA